ncbi:MAG: TonB-dependent receptor [Bacteroidales bacterium]|nr:TonB-dependent receptor [Bacteroidales bacterium]
MRILSLLILTLIAGKMIFAQTIEAYVYDESTKLPLQDVNILKNDSTIGCYTDINGYFKLDIREWDTLLISHIGYLSKEYVNDPLLNKFVIYLKKSPTMLNAVQVSITKNHQSNYSQLASISFLTKKQIQENVSRSMAEAMMIVPGVWMQKTNHGGGSPFVRGLTGNYTLLLIDGIRMNNSTYRYGPNQYFNTISPFSIKSIEVLRGAGSILYGSDAIGGTINTNTQNLYLNQNKKIYGSLGGQFMSHGMEYTGNFELAGSYDKFAFITNASIREFGDIFAGGDLGYERPSGYGEKDFLFKALWKVSNNSKLTLNYQWFRQDDVPRYDQVSQRNYEYYNFTIQQRQLAYLRYDKVWLNKPLKNFQLTASIQESNEERDTKKNDSPVNKNERDDITTFGLIAQLDASLFKKIEMISGIDLYYDWISSSRVEENLQTGEDIVYSRGLYPDGSNALTTALYNTYLNDINNWTFQLGWRYSYTVNRADDDIFNELNLSSSSFVWNAGVNYQLRKTRIYTSLNTAFRAPNINDIGSLGDFDYGIEVPATDLKPETSINFEIGQKTASSSLNFNTSYFYTKIKNLIDRVPSSYNGDSLIDGSRVYTKANVGEAFITGIELELEKKIATILSIRGSMTYTYGQNITKNEPFRRIPPLFGDLSLRYNKDNYFIILQIIAAGKQNRLSSGDIDDHRIPEGGTPGWIVTNIKSGIDWKRVSLKLAFNNVFNEAYRYHGSGVDGLGRHLAASLRYHF